MANTFEERPDMSPEKRNQITITLSDGALEEYAVVARWKKQPLATILREILEQHHAGPAFGNTVKRARQALGDRPDDDEE